MPNNTCTYCGVEITFIGEHNCYQKRVAALEVETARLKFALSEYRRQDKCIVKNCKNHTHQGQFVGDMCLPCYQFITTGQGRYSQVYRNAAVLESEECAKIADRYVGCEQISASIRARVNKHEL